MEDEYKKLMKECLKDAKDLVGEEDIIEPVLMIAIELFKIRLILV